MGDTLGFTYTLRLAKHRVIYRKLAFAFIADTLYLAAASLYPGAIPLKPSTQDAFTGFVKT